MYNFITHASSDLEVLRSQYQKIKLKQKHDIVFHISNEGTMTLLIYVFLHYVINKKARHTNSYKMKEKIFKTD